MASRYLKIPVVQKVAVETPGLLNSYSKVLKTLRIPQELLGTSTGSLYFSGQNSSDGGTPAKLRDIIENELQEWESFYVNGTFPGGRDWLGKGLWMQIPLNASKTLFENYVSGKGVEGPDSYLQYNGALWLRVSQEVSFISKAPSTSNQVFYTYPFVTNLLKENNSAYEMKYKEEEAFIGDKGYNQVQKLLQDKLQKCLVSNPGARETLLDFGKTNEQLDAGRWNIESPATLEGQGLDPNSIVLTTQEQPKEGREFINGECKLVVTCAIITGRGQGVADPDQVDALQSYVTLGETWGYGDDFYDESIIGFESGSSPSGVQEINLNPAQLYSNGASILQQFTGDIASDGVDARCCEGFTTGPTKGK